MSEIIHFAFPSTALKRKQNTNPQIMKSWKKINEMPRNCFDECKKHTSPEEEMLARIL